MSRIRSIHPGLFTDEAFMSASAHARLLIIGTWTEADDQGIFEWKPITLKVRLFPADNVSVVDLLAELESFDFLRRFTAGGKEYGAIRNFRKWQRPKSPTIVHHLPDDLRAYVGLADDGGDPEQELRKRKHREQDGKCAYCRTEITYYSKKHESLELDHVIPKCRGGSDEPSNLVASCRTCNRSKGSMTGDEFRSYLAARIIGSGNAKSAHESAKVEFAPQMEDGGDKREEKKAASAASLPAPTRDPLVDFKRSIVDAFAAARSMNLHPDTHRASIWIQKGYDPVICLAVIAERLARKPNIMDLSYFDNAIHEAHEKRAPARAPTEKTHDFGGGVVWPYSSIAKAVDAYLADRSSNRHWPGILGPPPGFAGCRVPPALLPPNKEAAA